MDRRYSSRCQDGIGSACNTCYRLIMAFGNRGWSGCRGASPASADIDEFASSVYVYKCNESCTFAKDNASGHHLRSHSDEQRSVDDEQ